jgi:hypothetical protein
MPGMPALQRVHDARERAIALLSDAFAQDALDVDEFERRVTRVHTTDSIADIEAVVADLPNAAALTPAAPSVALVPAGEARDEAPQTIYAVMGGVERRGSWTVPRRM